MKIIGGRDYYDSAAQYGIDTSIRFVRNNRAPLEAKDLPIEIPRIRLRFFKKKTEISFSDWFPVFVIIGDKIWHGIKIIEPSNYRIPYQADYKPYETHYHWSLESLNASVEKMKMTWKGEPNSWDKEYFGEQNITKSMTEWMVFNNVAIITGEQQLDQSKYEINLNQDNLKNFEFFKVIDAFQLHQRIEQWVSGVLPQSENPMINISDQDKAHKHGFWKWSFRTPGKKGME